LERLFLESPTNFILLYYLPIYFQLPVAIWPNNQDNILLVLTPGFSSLVAGGVITATGYFTPVVAFGSCLASIGAGLIYTLDVDNHSREWIGYQVLLGIGIGSIFQIPATVAQSVVDPEDLSAASAMVLFFQSIAEQSGCLCPRPVSLAYSSQPLRKSAPRVSSGQAIATGAIELRQVFKPDQVSGIVKAYIDGLRIPFAISIACGCATFLLGFVPGWQKTTVSL
jgi:hypothetical protein